MTLARCALALSLTSCAAVQAVDPAPAPPAERANRFSIYLGRRQLDSDAYEPVDDQPALGLEYVRESPGSALGFEAGWFASRSLKQQSGTEIEGHSSEIFLGAQKSFGLQAVHPYLGMGVSIIATRLDVRGSSDDGASLGYYAHGGIRFDVSSSLYLGLDLRTLYGSDIEYDAGTVDGDYVQWALLAGFAF